MAEPIIRVEHLGKKYLLKHKAGGERYHALRDVLAGGLKTGFRLFAKDKAKSPTREEFWALKDVSFEVNEGEVVGIIGRNGAGKSTLLKILSRITEPTTGRVTLNGRVASLLEVGTGFHPELTGRENIYLNGTILGMRRAEIARKFDEIVAFAEVEKFLDTPVKRYSSGMYVRLAFAVAAHLEPEILVVDEVLAVGDAAFQKKCLGKMGEVARGGRTVLFVSHNMQAVQTLCRSCIRLERGRMTSQGDVNLVVSEYLATQQVGTHNGEPIPLGPDVTLTEFATGGAVRTGDPFRYQLAFEADRDVNLHDCCILIYSPSQVRVAIIDLRRPAGPYTVPGEGRLVLQGEVPRLNLVEGVYSLGLYIRTPGATGDHYDLASLVVHPIASATGIVPYHASNRGYIELSSRVTSNVKG